MSNISFQICDIYDCQFHSTLKLSHSATENAKYRVFIHCTSILKVAENSKHCLIGHMQLY